MNPESDQTDAGGSSSSLDSGSLESSSSFPENSRVATPRKSSFYNAYSRSSFLVAGLSLILILTIGLAGYLYSLVNNKPTKSQQDFSQLTAAYGPTSIPLQNIKDTNQVSLSNANRLVINGSLQVNKAFSLSPTSIPSTPTAGEIYYNQTTNQPYYYNGSQFVSFTPTVQDVTSLGGASGVLVLGNGLQVAGNQLTLSSSVLQSIANAGISGPTVDSLQGQTGKITVTGTASQVIVSTASGNVNISLPQDIGTASDVQFGSLSLGSGDLTLTPSAFINSDNISTVNSGDTLVISGGNNITFENQNGANTFTFPTNGGAGQVICTTAITCASGGGQAVLLEPTGIQTASSNKTAVFINKSAGTGNLIELQTNGNDAFVINNAGNTTINNLAVTNGITANSLTSGGTLTVGSTSQPLILQGNGLSELTATSGGSVSTLEFAAPSANRAIVIPDASGTVCLTVGNCLGGAGGGANINLSDLSNVAINTNLLPGSAGAVNLGSATFPFGQLYLAGNSGTPGTNNFLLTGTSSSGTRTITLPDASGTVCLQNSASCGFAIAGTGVTQLNGLNGALSIANAATGGSTITINNASTSAKGLSEFNNTNFSVAAGVVNTIQDIDSGASPTFSALTLGTAGSTNGTLQLANSTNTNLVDVAGLAPSGTGTATIDIPSIAGGTSDTVCLLTLANCVGTGGGVSTSGGTQNYVPKYNNAGATQLSNSEIYDNGSGVAIGSTATTGLFNVGTASQFNVSNTGAVTAVGVNSGTGLLQGSGGLTVSDSGTTETLASAGDTVQTNTNSTTGFQVQNTSSVEELQVDTSHNIVEIYGNLDTATNTHLNIGYANATGISIGNTGVNNTTAIYGSTLIQSATGLNSPTAFQVQNAGGDNLLLADTLGNNVYVGATGTTALSSTVNIGTSTSGSNDQTVNVGSLSSSSTTTIQSGTGGVSIASGNATGTTGNISLQTGNSSTSTPGNVSVDTGTGVLSGTPVVSDDFEGSGSGSMDDWGTSGGDDWFNATETYSNSEAHSGNYSLEITEAAGGWGAEEDYGALSITPGDEYSVSLWFRAGTAPEAIGGVVAWVGSGEGLNLSTITDSTTGWTEMTGEGIAPVGATSAYIYVGSDVGNTGNIVYMDDLDVTDLTNITTPSIDIGASNAEAITIGNDNQAGATSLLGGGGGINITAGDNANVNVGTTNTNNVFIGSGQNNSATTIQGGTGNVTINTGSGSGTTGSISIISGNSLGTVSGNINIDTGTGVITGTNILDDTFEGSGSGSVDDLGNCDYGCSVAPSNTYANSGSYSLAISESSQFWAVDENYLDLSITAGDEYYVTAWFRGTSAETINGVMNWDTGGSSSLNSYTDTTTGWTEMTGEIVAPAGSTAGYLDIYSNTGNSGNITYMDDVVVQNVSNITEPYVNVGASNAEAVTVGNLQQAGLTSIVGGVAGISEYAATNATISVGTTNSNNVNIGNSNGTVVVQGTGAQAVQIQNSTNQAILDVDTTDNSVGIGTSTPTTNRLDVVGATPDNTTNALNVTNSLGSELIQASDDGSINLGGGNNPVALGYTTAGGSPGIGDNGILLGNQFTAESDGTLTSMSAYVGDGGVDSSPNNKYQFSIYSDNSGQPDNLLASSNVGDLNPSASWNTLPITPLSVTAGTKYWLVYWTNTSSPPDNNMAYDSVLGAVGWYQSDTFGSGIDNGLPPIFPSGGAADNVDHSIYANYASKGLNISSDGDTTAYSAATFQDQADSTNAFQVQNSAGDNLLTADTTNNEIVLGQDNTPSDITVRGGAASGSDQNGSNITFDASNGTGSGGSGSFIFRTAKPSGTAISVDNTGTEIGSGTTATLAFTTGSEAGRLLVVTVITATGNSYTAVTYDGLNLTQLDTVDNNVRVEMWYLVNPPSGTYNIIASSVNPWGNLIGATDFYNVNQTTPFGTVATSTGTTTGIQSSNLSVTTTSSSQVVVDGIGTDSDGPTNYLGGQTQLWNQPPSGGSWPSAGGEQQGTGGVVNMSWDVDSSDWADIGVPLNPTANTTADGLSDSLVIAPSGNVGIDNANPQYALDVSGQGRIQSTTDSTDAFQVQDTSGANLFQVDTENDNIYVGGNNSAVLQPWVTNANNVPAATTGSVSLTANGYIYRMGGYNGSTTINSVYYAPINSNGSVGSWTTSSNHLPTTLAAATGFVSNGYAYIFGGNTDFSNNATVQSAVYYAKLNADGSVGSWQTASNSLPLALGSVSGGEANGYAYVIGGIDSSNNRHGTVYYAKLNADGSVGSWTTSSNNLPQALDNGGVAVANGYIYYLGGWDGSNDQDTVYYAALNSDGSINAWATATNNLPIAMAAMGVAVDNGYLYTIGGAPNGSSSPTNAVYYTPLNSDGSLGTWATNPNSLPNALDDTDNTVVANGYIYFLDGTTNPGGGGADASTVYYSSTQRVEVGGSLDLVGLAGQTLTDSGNTSQGDTAGSITAGNITSVGDLQIQGQADIVGGITDGGTLNVSGSVAFQNTSATAFQVQNSAGTSALIVSTNNTLAYGGATTASLEVGEDSSSGYSIAAYGTISGGLGDYAEYFNQGVSGQIQPGDVVCMDNVGEADLCNSNDQQMLIGVESTNPGYVGNARIYNASDPGATALVSLVGQVPVEVTAANGPIAAGDRLTYSGSDGVAELQTGAGMSIGTAMTSYNGSGVGTVQVYLNIGYYVPSEGNSIQSADNTAVLNGQEANLTGLNVSGQTTLQSLTVTESATIANLTVTGSLATATLTVNGHIISGGSSPTITSDAAACTNPTVSISGTDTSGTITVTTGKTCLSNGALADVKFAAPFGSTPHVVLTPGGLASAALNAYVDDSSASVSGFTIGSSTTPSDSTTYYWNYVVIQ